jgi:hypothetical protein
MPREKREAMLHEREILGFLEQSHISPKNLARLGVLGRFENTRIAELARLVLDVGAATPYRRRRTRILARERRDVLNRMEEAGLIMPLTPPEDFDPFEIDSSDIDPVAVWNEWVQYAQNGDDDRDSESQPFRGGGSCPAGHAARPPYTASPRTLIAKGRLLMHRSKRAWPDESLTTKKCQNAT